VDPKHRLDEAGKARLLLAMLAVVWGTSWPMMRIALDEVSVWTLRGVGYAIGTAILFAVIALRGHSAAIPRGHARLHVLVAPMFHVVGFGLFSAFAQLSATTSRVVIVNYSMPIWASLMAWPVLGERLNARSVVGLALCIAGLVTLIYPAAAVPQSAHGLLLALGCSLCWAAGTIYMKWARIPGDLLAITAWQMVPGVVVFAAGYLIFEGIPHPALVSPKATFAILYNGFLGTGLAFILWFAIIARLPTATASLGALATPVVGVLSSMLILSERPTVSDVVGFALIFAAAMCVLVQPRPRSKAGPNLGSDRDRAALQPSAAPHDEAIAPRVRQ
jgi:drug/metabolite transporter (DMT)-like permease